MAGERVALFEALDDAGARFLVAGGVAVVLHGSLRTTVDLDLILDLDPENVLRALQGLANLGYRPRAPVKAEEFADPAIRQRWIEEKNLQVFSLWSDRFPTLEVDLFVSEPFDFDRVYERAPRVQLGRASVRVVPLRELIDMKRRAGRPRDLEDVAALESLARSQERPGER